MNGKKRMPGFHLVILMFWLISLTSGWVQFGKGAETDNLLQGDPCGDDRRCPWLYLRDGQAVQNGENLVQIIAVGDIQTGRGTRTGPKTFELVAPWIQSADLAIGNFEGVIAHMGMNAVALAATKPDEPYRLVSPAGVEKVIEQAGFDILGLANNHVLDLDRSGIQNTMNRLKRAGLQVFGLVDPETDLADPLVIHYQGIRIAFVGYTLIRPVHMQASYPLPALFDPLHQAVRQARQEADIVIVSIHWGFEYQLRPDPHQELIAKALFEAGADVVLGHHPHVVQGTKVVGGSQKTSLSRDHFVAYSQGNFVFDQFADETRYGLALRLFVDTEGLRAVQALPILATTRPRLLDRNEAGMILERIIPEPEKMSFTCKARDCQLSPAMPAGKEGIFGHGQIDLTGDGVSERIEFRNGKVLIYEKHKLAWKNPEDWRIVDLDLGDPNLDGRYEIILSVRKTDQDGILRSHPYIVGYRDGRYKLLWGGSALSTPINEVALGDVDGDQNQELIVLEEIPNGGGTALSVWRWHGWGFSLMWRSAGNTFRNLILVRGDQDSSVDIQVEKTWGANN